MMFLRNFVGICIASIAASFASDINVDLPLGVPLNRKALYDSAKNFVCFDGSNSIPFAWVNDDYCDCPDGSDEPGTSACPRGTFTCRNLGHKPQDIPSSRVNDQICDCCDGSDEWAGYVRCPNICEEIGKKAREEDDRRAAMMKEGYQKRLELSKEGKKMKEEKLKKIDELQAQQREMEPKRTELETVKQAIENKEREAKDAHSLKWRAELEAKKQATDRFKAEAAFEDLDVNKDNKISIEEIVPRVEFDKNLDGKVSEEEATERLGGKTEVSFDHFVDEIWSQISHLYKPPLPAPEQNEPEKPVEASTPSPPPPAPKIDDESIPGEENEEEVKEDEVQDFDVDKYPKVGKPGQPPAQNEEEKMPEYDEETKKLIAEADEARKAFNEVDGKIRDAEDEIKKLEEYSKLDLGPDDEYAPLYNQCFEYTERQYTYKLCLFDRTSQRNKDGGSDTNLGRFDSWSGPEGDKYSRQSYKNGLSCWNGPERSTEVRLSCGSENKLTGASEPGRCEYLFEFTTPAACVEKLPEQHPEHEL